VTTTEQKSVPRVGDTFTEVLAEDLKRTQIVQYAGASGDFNALHTDEVYAREIGGFPSVFGHGMLTMAMTGRLLTDVVGIENLTRFGGRFTAQVWPGDTLTGTLSVLAVEQAGERYRVELAVRTVNQHDAEVFAGTATARI
jgi:acyl dehydratase